MKKEKKIDVGMMGRDGTAVSTTIGLKKLPTNKNKVCLRLGIINNIYKGSVWSHQEFERS